MDSAFLVSVVIATHNRSKYAIDCVRSILDIASDDIQVVVHDTSNDSAELRGWASSVDDLRLTYVHCSTRLSMTENHESALKLATGEYICLVGDDDSVSKRILDVAAFAKRESIFVVTPPVKATYYWPDFRTKFFGSQHAGKIYLDKFTGGVSYVSSEEQLMLSLSEACQGTDKLPKLYHGLVHNTVLDKIRAQNNGVLLYGTSPDISASLSLCLVGTKSYCSVDLPFTIPGGSAGSNSGRSALGKHKGDLKTDPHLAPFKNLVWHEEIPKFFSVETVWAHAAWETLKNSREKDKFEAFNLAKLYALCLFHHWGYRKLTFKAIKNSKNSKVNKVGLFRVVKEFVSTALMYVYSRGKRLACPTPSNGREVVSTVASIYEARKRLDACLDDKLKGMDLPYLKV